MMSDADTLVHVTGLKKHFPVTRGIVVKRVVGQVHAVDGVDFAVRRGSSFGVVGESGCGKTTLAKLLLLIERPTAGEIRFDGTDINRLAGAELSAYRSAVQPVFQDPYASLSPRMPVWEIISEPLLTTGRVPKRAAKERAAELLETVGLSRQSLNLYPHQFSGGQRQRIAIARALSARASFLVLDEPVSALDVSIRAQIMNLLKDLQRELQLTLFMIAHDLGSVRYLSDVIAVMYLGQIVEIGPSAALYARSLHPYTQALLASALPHHPDAPRRRQTLSGEIPSPLHPPSGCRFHTRCPMAMSRCAEEEPAQREPEREHLVACHLY